MLPGLRLGLAAIGATILIVVLGFGQLVKLQVAQSQSDGLAPVEARFAGLAFAARADWTPAIVPAGTSLESLAPFANRMPDRVNVDHQLATARTVALIHPAPEATIRAALAPQATENPTGLAQATNGTAPTKIAALMQPPAGAALVPASREVAELNAATLQPAPPAIPSAVKASEAQATGLTAMAEPSAEVLPQPPVQIATVPADIVTGQIQKMATAAVTEPDTVRLPIARPGIVSTPDHTVKLPPPRPTVAAPPKRKASPRRARKRAARAPARRRAPVAKPTPPASAAPSNPFAALFGGSSTTNTPPN